MVDMLVVRNGCQGCEIFIKWDGLQYPCCGNRLRLRPRNLTDKKRFALRSKQKNENIEIRQKIPVPLINEQFELDCHFQSPIGIPLTFTESYFVTFFSLVYGQSNPQISELISSSLLKNPLLFLICFLAYCFLFSELPFSSLL